MRLPGLLAVTIFLTALACSPRQPAAVAPAPAAADNHYVNPALCVGCHASLAEGYKKTGMGRSFAPIRPDNKPAPASFYHKASDTHYAIVERNGEIFHRRWQIGIDGKEMNVEEKRVDYVVGSGNHSRTYLHLTASKTLQQLPLHWYAENGGSWAMSPGFDRPDYPGSTRRAGYDCMFCHNAYPRIPEGHEAIGAEPVYLEPLPEGIDCQRCHGPGQHHIDVASKPGANPDTVRAAIVNPRRLPPDRALEVCLQCHLSTTTEKLPASLVRPDRSQFSYIPGQPLGDFRLSFDRSAGRNEAFENLGSVYRLRQSQCFLQSQGKLQCITCHNPHSIPRGPEAAAGYNAKCRECHSSVKVAGHTPDANCTGCHMPKRRTDDEVHVVMTDHLIQRKPPANLLATKIETHETPATQYRGEVVRTTYPELPDTPANALDLAVAQIRDASNLKEGLPRLAALIDKHRPANPRYYSDLAEGYVAAGDLAQAANYFKQAIERSPAPAFLLSKLGSVLLQSRQAAQAEEVLRRAAALAPTDPLSQGLLGWALFQQGKTAEAKATLEKAIALDPDSPEAHSNLASLFASTGDMAAAEKELRTALRILPNVPTWQSNLGGILADQNRRAEARYHFEQTVRLTPDDPAAQIEYARLLAVTGDRTQAIEHLKIAAASPDPQASNLARQLLQKLTR